MKQVVKAATPEEIARVEGRQKLEVEAAEKAAKEPPKFVAGLSRETIVLLDFPMTYDGVEYSEIRIRRPTMREWRAYIRACEDAVKQDGPGADDLIDQPWMSAPAVLIEALDFVDGSRVEAAQDGFFGRSSSQPEATADGQSTSGSDTGGA